VRAAVHEDCGAPDRGAAPGDRGTAGRTAAPQHGSTAALILSALEPDDGADLDDLQALTGLDVSALTRHLTELELAGLAVRQPGGRFVRSSGK
jgi:predicted Rossmann fold nucleotide-binding protein DprA/Smf involved in DNA uptake